jgi:hypothetical protein
VTDYLNRIAVTVIGLTDRDVRRGDEVRIAGRTTSSLRRWRSTIGPWRRPYVGARSR